MNVTAAEMGTHPAMKHVPSTILVTGGAGFIGSNLVHWLLRHDPAVRVVTLDALTYAGDITHLADLPDPARHLFVHGDIRDRDLVARLLREQAVDTVVHLAAESHVDCSIERPDAFVQTNVVGTFTLLEECRRAWLDDGIVGGRSTRFHHVSTDEVFGSLGPSDPAFNEQTPFAPSSPYSASKAGSDHLVRAYWRTFGLGCTLSHCSNNYGPRQHREKFIPTVIRSCACQVPIPVYGRGINIRDWLFVDDHCAAIERIVRMAQDGDAFNVGGRCERSNIEVARLICARMDLLRPSHAPHDRLITFVKDRPGHDLRYAIDATAIERRLGWGPMWTFEEGLAYTIDHVLQAYGEGVSR